MYLSLHCSTIYNSQDVCFQRAITIGRPWCLPLSDVSVPHNFGVSYSLPL